MVQSAEQGRNEGARGRNYPGAKSLWRRCNTAGAPNDCVSSKMCQQYHTYILQYSTFVSGRPQVRKWGRQTCFLPRTPSNLVTPLSIWILVASRNSSTHLHVTKLRCRQTADWRTALAIALKSVFRLHFEGLWNLESVTSFPYCIPIFTAAFPFPFKAVNRH